MVLPPTQLKKVWNAHFLSSHRDSCSTPVHFKYISWKASPFARFDLSYWYGEISCGAGVTAPRTDDSV
jgi:hypothetical protein